MDALKYKRSDNLSVGVELELQLIDPESYDLIASAKHVLRNVRNRFRKESPSWQLKPELTQSMIEINSGVHSTIQSLYEELKSIRYCLKDTVDRLGIKIAGGGTHPFQSWRMRKIFPTPRYQSLFRQYGYLAQRFTVFGQHIHIGCANPDDAIYLTGALSRYAPHFIAMSASSPFYQGVDTNFDCTRLSVVSAFPLSGIMPDVKDWQEFQNYFEQMQKLNVVKSIKDFYWDIRPKPEYGTIELRICDTPLNMLDAAKLTAYLQALCRYLLLVRPFQASQNFNMVYQFNRFLALRYGYAAKIVDPVSEQRFSLRADILNTLELIKPHFSALGSLDFYQQLHADASDSQNGAKRLRRIYNRFQSLPEVVKWATTIWLKD
jgi:carboxylate-amine ligase